MANAVTSRIVVGVDGSEGADRALEWAAQEALLRGAPLEVVHAWMPPAMMFGVAAPAESAPFAAHAQATLDRATGIVNERRPAPETIRARLVEGDAAAALIRAAERAQLLVVGSRGRGGFAGLVLGSVGLQCATHAACPVAVVRGAQDSRPHGRIVVGVDGSEPSYGALHWAVTEAERRGARLDVVHAYSYVPVITPFGAVGTIDPNDIEAASRALLADMISAVVEPTGLPLGDVRPITSPAAPAAALLEAADGADLLVVGSRGRGGFRGLLLGSVSQHCLHHAPCPVVVVRTAEQQSDDAPS